MVRQCVSSPITSSVGFPEGCPLSPAAMAVVDLAWHTYMSAFEPRVSSHSFVDNLSLTARGVLALARGWQVAQAFCEMLEVELDAANTYAWPLQPRMRQELSALQLLMCLFARDLGGHMSYGGRVRVRVTDLKERCSSLDSVWKLLARSYNPIRLKIFMLPAKCWPKALHGTLGCPGGADEIQRLRTAATKSIKIHPAGSNSLVRLSLCQVPEADPGFYMCHRALCDFRRLCTKQPHLLSQWQLFQTRFWGLLPRAIFYHCSYYGAVGVGPAPASELCGFGWPSA